MGEEDREGTGIWGGVEGVIKGGEEGEGKSLGKVGRVGGVGKSCRGMRWMVRGSEGESGGPRRVRVRIEG